MTRDATTLLLVGAGELGSRHLQGLASVDAAAIVVVEPHAAARERAAARYGEVVTASSAPLRFVDRLDDIAIRADVGIVATGSLQRRDVIEALARMGLLPRHLVLEKFLFPAIDDYAAVAAATAEIDVVVNTPRRRWQLYRALRERLGGAFTLRVRGTAWGLCCNAVHFADVFSALVGGAPSTTRFALDDGVVAAKRAGYVEMHGVVVARSGDNTLELQCAPGDAVTIDVEIVVDGVVHRIDERSGACVGLGIATASPPFQSADTGALVTSLLRGEPTGLPTLAASTASHLPLLGGFLEHYRRFVAAEATSCPIT